MKAAAKAGAQPVALKDFRRALDDKSIDAITIAVPDHWHTPMAILALAAGKHVYVEKPCSQNPHEGELLLKAIARYNKLVQMGNQRRSFPNMQVAVKEIRDGIIGRAYYAKAWYDNQRASIGVGTATAVPTELGLRAVAAGSAAPAAPVHEQRHSPTTGTGSGTTAPARP